MMAIAPEAPIAELNDLIGKVLLLLLVESGLNSFDGLAVLLNAAADIIARVPIGMEVTNGSLLDAVMEQLPQLVAARLGKSN